VRDLALARSLEDFRREVDAPVFISAMAGIDRLRIASTSACRSQLGNCRGHLPRRRHLSRRRKVDRALRRDRGSLGAEVRVRLTKRGDDHLQVDLGYLTIVPRECSES